MMYENCKLYRSDLIEFVYVSVSLFSGRIRKFHVVRPPLRLLSCTLQTEKYVTCLKKKYINNTNGNFRRKDEIGI